MKSQGFSLFWVVLFSLGIGFSSSAKLLDRVNAIVNKKAIYHSDVTRFEKLRPLRMKIDSIFAAHALARESNPSEKAVTDFLVSEALILERFPVTDAEVEQEISGIQANLKIDRPTLRSAIEREGFSFEDYFSLMRASIAKRQLIDREIRTKAAVSDDDLKAEYYRSRAGKETFSGLFRIHLLKFPKKNYRNLSLAKFAAKSALAEVESGKSFEAFSDEHAEVTGGDLGYLAYSDMSKPLQKTVQAIGPNSMSSIFEDSNHYMIVKTGEIKADVDPAFEKSKERLRGKLLEKEFSHQLNLWLKRERQSNFVKINVS